jgi:hypothetical protein
MYLLEEVEQTIDDVTSTLSDINVKRTRELALSLRSTVETKVTAVLSSFRNGIELNDLLISFCVPCCSKRCSADLNLRSQ